MEIYHNSLLSPKFLYTCYFIFKLYPISSYESTNLKTYYSPNIITIKVENYIGKKRSEVQNVSLRFTFVGKGNKVIDQLPRKGEYVEEGDTIVIMLGE